MKFFPAGWAACASCFLVSSALATEHDVVVPGTKSTGPACAYACHRSINTLVLACSNQDSHADSYHRRGLLEVTSPECRGSDTPYLTTLAWCMSTRCAHADSDAAISSLQRFWEQFATGDESVKPKWDFQAALHIANATSKPLSQLASDAEMLDSTALVNPAIYREQYDLIMAPPSGHDPLSKTDLKSRFQPQTPNQQPTGTTKSRYLSGTTNLHSLIILLTSLALPVLLTLLSRVRMIPLPTATSSNLRNRYIKPYLIYPSTYKSYQVQPLPYLLGTIPTRGQSLYILSLFALILALCAIDLQYKTPHTWYPAINTHQTITHIFQRAGVFAFVLLPLTILFSSRNNLLLWATDWSHSTFLVLHRWGGRMCALLALVHSLLALPLYLPGEERKAYWIWGAVATVGLGALVVGSGLYVRRFVYELFLVGHIVLAVVVIVGCWYHVHQWMGLGYGYMTWLIAACGVWLFDRLVRVGRLFGNGVRRARVREIGEGKEYVRVDVEGVQWGSARPGMHVYAQFPTLNRWRPWENHPFSVMPTCLLLPEDGAGSSSRSSQSGDSSRQFQEDVLDLRLDAEKGVRVSEAAWSSREEAGRSGAKVTSGITMLIKKSSGLTKRFKDHDSLLTLLDGPYPNNSASAVLKCERLVLIGGGIGITAVLPWVAHHSNTKLYWSVRDSAKCLVNELEGTLHKLAEKHVKVGGRFNIQHLLADEMDLGWSRVGVIVSGPGGLCDDVRAAVALAGRKGGAVFELEVDAYSW